MRNSERRSIVEAEAKAEPEEARWTRWKAARDRGSWGTTN